jgi:hypothetical protein
MLATAEVMAHGPWPMEASSNPFSGQLREKEPRAKPADHSRVALGAIPGELSLGLCRKQNNSLARVPSPC